MAYPSDNENPDIQDGGKYKLYETNFASDDTVNKFRDDDLFRKGYKNAGESKPESVPDAHTTNWFYDLLHRNIRYTKKVAEENKRLIAEKTATRDTLGQVRIGDGLNITDSGLLYVVKKITDGDTVISYDLPLGTLMFWAGTVESIPQYFIEPNGQELLRSDYSELHTWAQQNNLIASGNEFEDGKLFGIGNGSTTFKVFDIRDQFIKIATNNKALYHEEAGLPNITGRVGMGESHFAQECFVESSGVKGKTQVAGSMGTDASAIFDASLSSDIYGKSTTVTPKNIALRLILKAKTTPASKTNPTGALINFSGDINSRPSGYIVADGSELIREQYTDLYKWAQQNNLLKPQSQIPTTPHAYYGTGDGSTTFTIPNLTGYSNVAGMITLLKV